MTRQAVLKSGSSKAPLEREMIAGLAKGLAVIKAFGVGGPFCTLAEIARLAELTPPAARRCLHTLESLGYVARDGRRFFLKCRVLELGAAYLEGVKYDELAQDYLQPARRQNASIVSTQVASAPAAAAEKPAAR